MSPASLPRQSRQVLLGIIAHLCPGGTECELEWNKARHAPTFESGNDLACVWIERKEAAAYMSQTTHTSLPWFSTTRTRSAACIQTVAVLSLGVDPDDAACEIGVQKDRRLPSLVVEKSQGRHGTRLEPHNGPKAVGRRKRERARTVPSPELLKVDAPVARCLRSCLTWLFWRHLSTSFRHHSHA